MKLGLCFSGSNGNAVLILVILCCCELFVMSCADWQENNDFLPGLWVVVHSRCKVGSNSPCHALKLEKGAAARRANFLTLENQFLQQLPTGCGPSALCIFLVPWCEIVCNCVKLCAIVCNCVHQFVRFFHQIFFPPGLQGWQTITFNFLATEHFHSYQVFSPQDLNSSIHYLRKVKDEKPKQKWNSFIFNRRTHPPNRPFKLIFFLPENCLGKNQNQEWNEAGPFPPPLESETF